MSLNIYVYVGLYIKQGGRVMNAKYQAIDVANYILWYAKKEHSGERITALKLHKLVYYAVVAYLDKFGFTPFDEKIEKWQYGPVVPSVYHEFKGQGYSHIAKPIPTISFNNGQVQFEEFDETIFEEDEQKVFNSTIDLLVCKSARDLVEMTHQESAWDGYADKIKAGCRNLQYSEEELRRASESLR